MAERFGGRYSPDAAGGAPPGTPPRPSRVGLRSNLLFVAPVPLLFVAFTSAPIAMALKLAAFGDLMLAAWLTREGLVAEDAYDARRVARRPALPRKLLGSLITGSGLALAGLDPASFSPVIPVIYFTLGAVLHFLSFGPDPMRDKGTDDIDGFQTDRAARAVDEAERHLAAMKDAIRRAGVPDLARRVDAFAQTARKMFRAVEDDPRDLTAARRYLSVYLQGARDATAQFADLYARSRNAQARSDYEALLDDLETSFTQKTEKLLLDDKSDLDVEIEVLRERLAREGVGRKT